jgi:hypothetical protein
MSEERPRTAGSGARRTLRALVEQLACEHGADGRYVERMLKGLRAAQADLDGDGAAFEEALRAVFAAPEAVRHDADVARRGLALLQKGDPVDGERLERMRVLRQRLEKYARRLVAGEE